MKSLTLGGGLHAGRSASVELDTTENITSANHTYTHTADLEEKSSYISYQLDHGQQDNCVMVVSVTYTGWTCQAPGSVSWSSNVCMALHRGTFQSSAYLS